VDRQLRALEEEEKANEFEHLKLVQTKDQLSQEEHQFWRDVNNYEKNLIGFQESVSQARTLISTLDS
jgi:hypothetical protein